METRTVLTVTIGLATALILGTGIAAPALADGSDAPTVVSESSCDLVTQACVQVSWHFHGDGWHGHSKHWTRLHASGGLGELHTPEVVSGQTKEFCGYDVLGSCRNHGDLADGCTRIEATTYVASLNSLDETVSLWSPAC